MQIEYLNLKTLISKTFQIHLKIGLTRLLIGHCCFVNFTVDKIYDIFVNLFHVV